MTPLEAAARSWGRAGVHSRSGSRWASLPDPAPAPADWWPRLVRWAQLTGHRAVQSARPVPAERPVLDRWS